MPRATVSTEFSEPIYLKTVEGGFIRVRPLPYGLKLERRDKATRMYAEFADSNTPTGRKSSNKNLADDIDRMSLETLNKWASAFDFRNCIGEHNLEDDQERLLDFSNPMVLDILDPRVGSEIEQILAEINGDDEDMEVFTSLSTASSQGGSSLANSEKTDDQ